MYYIKQKRKEIDNCNICGEVGKLTWDHIPPKSVKICDGAYANTLFSSEGMPTETKYMKKYQSGVKYRTICQKCNGELLSGYDKAYAEFIHGVDAVIKYMTHEVITRRRVYPIETTIPIDVPINKVLRSILGHFMAMKPIYDTDTTVDTGLRVYLQDEGLMLKDVKLYSWFYPFNTIVNCRDAAVRGYIDSDGIYTHPHGMISVMNSYPLAYLLSTEDEAGCCLDDLGAYSTTDIEEIVTIDLHMATAYYSSAVVGVNGNIMSAKRKAFHWPVNISDDAFGAMFVLGNDQIMDGSTIAIQR